MVLIGVTEFSVSCAAPYALLAMSELLDRDRYEVLSLATEDEDPLVHGVWEVGRFHPDEGEAQIIARGREVLLWLLDAGLIELIRGTDVLDRSEAEREIRKLGWDYRDDQPWFRSTEAGMKLYMEFRPSWWKPFPPDLRPLT